LNHKGRMMKKENIPNALTLARIALIPIFILILTFGHSPTMHILAGIIFALASITDYLDGYLARKWQVVTNFGKFADPMADKLLVMSAFIMLIEMKMAPAWVVAIIICRELAVTGLRLLLVETGGTVLAAAMPGKIKTFTQMFAILFLLLHWTLLGQILLYIAMIISRAVPISLKIHLNNMENIIEVKNLSYRYDHNSEDYILKDVSFHVKQGEWLSIVGHNGSGKSTTVRLIDGLLEAESGDIIISGDKLTADNVWEKRRQIGMVFQNPDNQFVGATVEDDVAFGLENQGMDYPMMVKRVHEALELVGMQNFKEREPARLSGGQKQRVAIAGVVALQPDIIILDEATSMLDPEGRLELIRTVKEIKDKNHLTVISITHDLDEISLSDRVLVMKNGQVESTATPRELFSRPDLEDLGLDQPFVNQVKAALIQTGLTLPETYLTEKELQEQLWELL